MLKIIRKQKYLFLCFVVFFYHLLHSNLRPLSRLLNCVILNLGNEGTLPRVVAVTKEVKTAYNLLILSRQWLTLPDRTGHARTSALCHRCTLHRNRDLKIHLWSGDRLSKRIRVNVSMRVNVGTTAAAKVSVDVGVKVRVHFRVFELRTLKYIVLAFNFYTI